MRPGTDLKARYRTQERHAESRKRYGTAHIV